MNHDTSYHGDRLEQEATRRVHSSQHIIHAITYAKLLGTRNDIVRLATTASGRVCLVLFAIPIVQLAVVTIGSSWVSLNGAQSHSMHVLLAAFLAAVAYGMLARAGRREPFRVYPGELLLLGQLGRPGALIVSALWRGLVIRCLVVLLFTGVFAPVIGSGGISIWAFAAVSWLLSACLLSLQIMVFHVAQAQRYARFLSIPLWCMTLIAVIAIGTQIRDGQMSAWTGFCVTPIAHLLFTRPGGGQIIIIVAALATCLLTGSIAYWVAQLDLPRIIPNTYADAAMMDAIRQMDPSAVLAMRNGSTARSLNAVGRLHGPRAFAWRRLAEMSRPVQLRMVARQLAVLGVVSFIVGSYARSWWLPMVVLLGTSTSTWISRQAFEFSHDPMSVRCTRTERVSQTLWAASVPAVRVLICLAVIYLGGVLSLVPVSVLADVLATSAMGVLSSDHGLFQLVS